MLVRMYLSLTPLLVAVATVSLTLLAVAPSVRAAAQEPGAAAERPGVESLEATAEAVQAGTHSSDAASTVPHASGHGGGGHHDDFDLGHGDAGPLMDNPIELRFDMAVASFAVFMTLLCLLSYFAWRPIMDGLDKRENGIAKQIADAQQSAQAAAEQLRQYQARLATATQEAQAIIVQARRNAELIAEQVRDAARQDAFRERDRAIADIQAAKSSAVREVSRHGADMAVLLAGRILRRELQAEDHASLIGEALDRFPSRN